MRHRPRSSSLPAPPRRVPATGPAGGPDLLALPTRAPRTPTLRIALLCAALACAGLFSAGCGDGEGGEGTTDATETRSAQGTTAPGTGQTIDSSGPAIPQGTTLGGSAPTTTPISTEVISWDGSTSTPYAPRIDTLDPSVDDERGVTFEAQLFPTSRPWPLQAAGFCWSDEVGVAVLLHPEADPLDPSVTCGAVTTLPQSPMDDLLLTLDIGALEGETTWFVQGWAENDAGRTLGGVVDFFTAPPAPVAEATQGNFINRVVLSWEAPPAGWGESWEEVRIYRGEGTTPVHVETDGEVFSWADRDAPRPVPSVAGVDLQVGEQQQGALLTWDAAEIPQSPRETWRVVGVIGGRPSAPTAVEGWVMRSEFAEYAYTMDGGATWVDTGSARGWVVEDAPAPVTAVGEIVLELDAGETLFRAQGFSIQAGEERAYQVRAMIDGAVSEASAPVTYARTGGSPRTWQWQRSQDEVTWEDVATAPEDEPVLAEGPEAGWTYRVALEAPWAATDFSAPQLYMGDSL